MKKRYGIIPALLFLFLASAPAIAGHKGECARERDCASCEYGKGKCPKGDSEYVCPIVGKFMSKAEFYLDNQKEIGLTDEQVASIKTLKLEVKKAYIRALAESQVFELEVHGKMSEPKVDAEAIGVLVDGMAAGMVKSTKDAVANYAKLKAVLTEEQSTKAKEIWLSNQH